MIASSGPRDAYERQKERSGAAQRANALAGRDIGEVPKVANPQRRARAESNPAFFLRTYFPGTFRLRWSRDHLRVIRRMRISMRKGGLAAFAMPRGSGKTSLCECLAIQSLLCGYRRFVALIGASEGHAIEMLDDIKSELENNELLLADFPEVCYPIVRLEGIANRCAGQLCNGQRTHIGWTEKEVILPTVEGSKASGGILRVAGITGRIRGMKYKNQRPDLVVVDDPQTDESAKMEGQCRDRLRVLSGAILGLAGPGQKISGFMPCTVIRKGDMADQILDRQTYPQWHGERTKMVYQWPVREDLWRQYLEIRADHMRAGGDGSLATGFYEQNREAMDAGSVVAWPARKEDWELSAIQHAWNLRQDYGEESFSSEYQNEPLDATEAERLTAKQIYGKTNNIARRLVPVETTKLTAFVDVQDTLLYWMVCAWWDGFSGAVVDYGTWPEQTSRMHRLSDINAHGITLEKVYPGKGVEGALYAGLKDLVGRLAGGAWQTAEHGAMASLSRLLVDAKDRTDQVFQFCRESGYPAVVMPRFGVGVKASETALTPRKPQAGLWCGTQLYVRKPDGRHIRALTHDTNWWKTFTYARLAAAQGAPGCVSLFGSDADQWQHEMLADHILAETPDVVTSKKTSRTIEEWKQQRGKDNHWWDCLVGCAVAASEQGIALREVAGPRQSAPRKRLSLSEMQNRAAGR